jgi:hypothetical protein
MTFKKVAYRWKQDLVWSPCHAAWPRVEAGKEYQKRKWLRTWQKHTGNEREIPKKRISQAHYPKGPD